MENVTAVLQEVNVSWFICKTNSLMPFWDVEHDRHDGKRQLNKAKA